MDSNKKDKTTEKDSSKRLYIALGVLVVLGGGVYYQQKQSAEEAASHSHEARVAELPRIEISEEATKEVDTIELIKPPKEAEEGEEASEEEAAGSKIVLKKEGEEDWSLQEPVKYKANASNVTSLLKNLENLKVTEQIAETGDSYDKWGVSDAKGLRATFKKGDETVLDLYFGDSGSRGQMTRLSDREGVYAIKGYSKYLYNRDAAGWRDKTIFKFDDKEAVKVTVENDNGVFSFEKGEGDDAEWAGTFQGEKDSKAEAIEEFKPSKVGDLLRAYKSLNASKFGDDKKASDVGLDEPVATVTIELKGGSGTHVLFVGDTAEGTNRWVRSKAKDTILSISSWAADWATAEASKFQEKKKDEAAEAAGDPPETADIPAVAPSPHGPH